MKKGTIILPALLLATLAIVVVLLAAQVKISQPTPTPTPIVDVQTQKLTQQETGDDVGSIEKDLKETDLLKIDQELSDIEKEISFP